MTGSTLRVRTPRRLDVAVQRHRALLEDRQALDRGRQRAHQPRQRAGARARSTAAEQRATCCAASAAGGRGRGTPAGCSCRAPAACGRRSAGPRAPRAARRRLRIVVPRSSACVGKRAVRAVAVSTTPSSSRVTGASASDAAAALSISCDSSPGRRPREDFGDDRARAQHRRRLAGELADLLRAAAAQRAGELVQDRGRVGARPGSRSARAAGRSGRRSRSARAGSCRRRRAPAPRGAPGWRSM